MRNHKRIKGAQDRACRKGKQMSSSNEKPKGDGTTFSADVTDNRQLFYSNTFVSPFFVISKALST